MGFFDKFKKKNEEKQESTNFQPDKPQDRVEIKGDLKSGITIDYYNANSDFKQFYDTTCLQIVDTLPVYTSNGTNIYNALVSWYGENDCIYTDEFGIDHNNRREDTKEIQLGLDFNKLSDPDYLRTLFTKLLEEKRVQKYLDMGLQENPQTPCGNYVGHLFYNPETGNYGKQFNRHIGLNSHNSPSQVKRRNKHRLELEEKRVSEIKKREEMIAKLQNEIDDMNRY